MLSVLAVEIPADHAGAPAGAAVLILSFTDGGSVFPAKLIAAVSALAAAVSKIPPAQAAPTNAPTPDELDNLTAVLEEQTATILQRSGQADGDSGTTDTAPNPTTGNAGTAAPAAGGSTT